MEFDPLVFIKVVGYYAAAIALVVLCKQALTWTRRRLSRNIPAMQTPEARGTPIELRAAPRAVRMGFWRYALRWLLLGSASCAVLLAAELRHAPRDGTKFDVAIGGMVAFIVLYLVIASAMWFGQRFAWRHGGRFGKWASTTELYGGSERPEDD